MKQKTCGSYRIQGRIVDQRTGRGLKNLRVEAWDKDMVIDDFLGSVNTDTHGGFEIYFDEADFKDLFFDKSPDLYFKVYQNDRLVADTQDEVNWNFLESKKPVEVKIDSDAINIGAGLGSTELFQFSLIRPVQRANLQAVRSKCALVMPGNVISDLHQQLRDLHKDKKRQEMIDRAKQYIAPGQSGDEEDNNYPYVSNVCDLGEGEIARLIDQLYPMDRSIFYSDLIRLIRETFANWEDVEDILGELHNYIQGKHPYNDSYKINRRRLGNSLIADIIDSTADPTHRNQLIRAIRICQLLERIAEEDEQLQSVANIEKALNANVILPKDVFPLPFPPITKPVSGEIHQRRKDQITQLTKDLIGILVALREMESVSPSHLTVVRKPPQQYVIVNPDIIDKLSELSKKTLTKYGIALDFVTLPKAIDILQDKLIRIGSMCFIPNPDTIATLVGQNQKVRADTATTDNINESLQENICSKRINRTNQSGSIKDLGIIEYMTVHQQLLGYEMGEVSHIENVLCGEYRERLHRRLRREEEVITTETEVKEESERDLQSTDRFEMKREISETLKEQHKLDAGVSITYKGAVIESSANAKYTFDRAKEEAEKVALSYSQEMINRSLSRLQERVREERVRRSIEEYEERNTHGIDNKDRGDHVIGVYRWVDKVYNVQIYGHGPRMVLEIIVPEPASLYLSRNSIIESKKIDNPLVVDWSYEWMGETFELTGWPLESYLEINDWDILPSELPEGTVVRPIQPTDITEQFYLYWAGKYGLRDINPPPPVYITKAKVYKSDQGEGTNVAQGDTLIIDDGYNASFATGWCWPGLLVNVGNTGYATNSAVEGTWVLPLEQQEIKEINLSVLALNQQSSYVASFEVFCHRTHEFTAKWQLEIFNAILQSLTDSESEYIEQTVVSEIQAEIGVSGHNPNSNREIEQIELKKGVIMLLTQGHLDYPSAISCDANGIPVVDFVQSDIQAPRIRFYEQAFDWSLMTYTFYPYYWSSRDRWVHKLTQIQNNDPLFEKFLKAGAARVLVPVREAYQEAVSSSLNTNSDQPWSGAENFELDEERSLSLLEEMQQQAGDMNNGVHIGDPWKMRVPTSLVILQEDSSLPGIFAQYKVKPGESLEKVAIKFGTTVEALQRLNQFNGSKFFAPGLFIKVPSTS